MRIFLFVVIIHRNLVARLNKLSLCDDYGISQFVKTPIHGRNILDKFFTNRPDIYTNCFTMKSTVKTKPLAVLVSSGCNAIENRNTNCQKCMLFDTREHNIDRLRYAIAVHGWS
jgi:hypothetical protein